MLLKIHRLLKLKCYISLRKGVIGESEELMEYVWFFISLCHSPQLDAEMSF